MKKLIIFDCDGVLIDSEIISSRLTAERLSNLGFSYSCEDIAKILIGTDSQTAKEYFKQISSSIASHFVHIAKDEILGAYETELEPLILPILQRIANEKINHCVVSNNTREKVLKGLEFTKQLHFFQAEEIFTAEQVENGKPAPDIFYLAMKHFGLKGEDCLVIEDSVFGIKGAIAAGIDVIGFLGGSHAQYSWYQEKIKALNVPYAHNSTELENLLYSNYL